MRKWTICQFEWHRDNKILLPSQRTTEMLFFEDGFLFTRKVWNRQIPLILSRRQDAGDRLSYPLANFKRERKKL